MQLSFLGATRNVTGSCYLIETGSYRLLVDCGMYQERDFIHRNWEALPVDPASVDAVLLTHAHLDHCGLLPKLVRDGFKGKIYSTAATADIARIILLDSAKIQEEDVAYKKKRHQKEGIESPHPYEPLYTIADAETCIERFAPVGFDKRVKLAEGLEAICHEAGHILGAALIRLFYQENGTERVLLFSGDVGRWDTPILRDPTEIAHADTVVCESTYGDRLHEATEDIPDALARVVNETHAAGGKLLIPSFAVERTQELLYHLSGLLADGRIPPIPTIVDSPMAIKVTEVFRRHPDLFDDEAAEMLRSDNHPCDFKELSLARTVDESKAINDIEGTAIVIAGSGMCTGGRIKHHLVQHIWRPECTILFVGYQAHGTLGRQILEGRDTVRLFGKSREMKARVERINGFSGHADRDELLGWLSNLEEPPRQLFLTHGEESVSESFAEWIGEHKGWGVTVPHYKDVVALG